MRSRWLPCLAVFLAGCATVSERSPVADPEDTWRMRQGGLRALQSWEIRGRLAMRDGEKSGQVNVVWVRDGDSHRINLFGPLGGGRVILTQDPEGARLRDARKRTYTAMNARELLYDTTGWRVPFDQLKYWLTGLPAPGVARDVKLDPWGRLATLRQAGWEVRFLGYVRRGALELPRKIFLKMLTGERVPGTEAAGKVEVRLVIKRWGLDP